MDPCLNCRRGLCEICEECSCCKVPAKVGSDTGDTLPGIPVNAGHSQDKSEDFSPEYREKKGVDGPRGRNSGAHVRSLKSDDDVRDPKSTGRKRAAVLFPLVPESDCEWKGLANCGGGKYPIVGCLEGKQEHRHHGPDKNTLNNSAGNVHRICDNCHNIWHSQNDPDYDPENPGKHEPRPADHLEIIKRFGGKYVIQNGS